MNPTSGASTPPQPSQAPPSVATIDLAKISQHVRTFGKGVIAIAVLKVALVVFAWAVAAEGVNMISIAYNIVIAAIFLWAGIRLNRTQPENLAMAKTSAIVLTVLGIATGLLNIAWGQHIPTLDLLVLVSAVSALVRLRTATSVTGSRTS